MASLNHLKIMCKIPIQGNYGRSFPQGKFHPTTINCGSIYILKCLGWVYIVPYLTHDMEKGDEQCCDTIHRSDKVIFVCQEAVDGEALLRVWAKPIKWTAQSQMKFSIDKCRVILLDRDNLNCKCMWQTHLSTLRKRTWDSMYTDHCCRVKEIQW